MWLEVQQGEEQDSRLGIRLKVRLGPGLTEGSDRLKTSRENRKPVKLKN